MLVLHDPTTFEHRTVELLGAKIIPALESPSRITAILEALSTASQHEVRNVSFEDSGEKWQEHVGKLLQLSHDPGYLMYLSTSHAEWVKEGLIQEDESILPECFRIPTALATFGKGKDLQPPKDVFARPGFYSFDMSSGISKDSWPAIMASANLAIEATKILVPEPGPKNPTEEEVKTVLALCRPPGHHCNTSMAGGYCYVNNVVVAIDSLRCRIAAFDKRGPHDDDACQEATSTKIAILDIDFHHGNGTQDAFYTSNSVLYLSIHGEDEYPYYSGFEDELGEGQGQGYNCNFPLKTGSSFEEYMDKLNDALGELAAFQPEYLFVSLGFDTFHLDPLGKFQIETDHYREMAKAIRCSKGANGVPCAILLEGGYVIDRLGKNMLSFLEGWEGGEKRKGKTPVED